MVLTEPHAGSDLGLIRTRAAPEGKHYRLFGQKIFITWGEHDLTPNIIHMVLARIDGAPPGTRGISLFLVPKFLVNDDGSLGAAQRSALRVHRAQDGHPREPDLHAGVRRRQGRDGVSHRRAQSRPRIHVHHDERRAPVGGRSRVTRSRSARFSARRSGHARACRASRRWRRRAGRRPSSIIRT